MFTPSISIAKSYKETQQQQKPKFVMLISFFGFVLSKTKTNKQKKRKMGRNWKQNFGDRYSSIRKLNMQDVVFDVDNLDASAQMLSTIKIYKLTFYLLDYGTVPY